MNKLKVKVKRINKNLPLPKYQTLDAAGFDLHASTSENITLAPGGILKISAGIAFEIPTGFAIFLHARSGLGSKGISLANGVGVIDSDYRGEVSISLINQSKEPFVIEPGMRLAQAILKPVYQAEFVEVEELSETERGTGGHGSTGLK